MRGIASTLIFLLLLVASGVESKKKSGLCVMKTGRDKDIHLPEPRMVILGSTGVGKSTLANVLIGCRPREDCLFEVCDGVDSCTKDTAYGIGNWTGSSPVFTVVDTPGFGDSDNNDNELIDEMIHYLKSTVNTTNLFLLSFNGEQDRLDSTLQQMIREVEALFGRKFWENVVLEFTHWPFDARSVANRNFTGKTESWKLETYNAGLREMFDVNITLPGVFVDSFSQTDFNLGDEDQQIAYERETSKLWNLLVEMTPFQFMTIEDVLGELFELRKEVDHLNKIIEDDIQEIKDDLTQTKYDLESLRVDTDNNGNQIVQNQEDIKNTKEDLESVQMESIHNKGLISMNEQQIKSADLKIDNVSSELNELQVIVVDGLQDQQNQISELDHELDSLTLSVNSMTLLPVGSIIAWSGKVISNSELPVGWQLCDGSKITEGPMKDMSTPALNVEGRFLRGVSECTNWSYQEHMMPSHQHSFSDPGHKHEDAGHTHVERHHIFNQDYHQSELREILWLDGEKTVHTMMHLKYNLSITENSHANIQSSKTGISIGDPTNTKVPLGDEVRPKNMAVQWIIKIY